MTVKGEGRVMDRLTSAFRWFTRKLFSRCIHLVSRGRQSLRYLLLRRAYRHKVVFLRKEYRCRGNPIRVGFYVVYDSVFPAKQVFELMLDDPAFKPTIVVIPDICRGKDNECAVLHKTEVALRDRYSSRCEVLCSFDKNSNNYMDMTSRFDIICSANPYRGMTDYKYTVEHASEIGVLSFFVSYGYVVSQWGLHAILDARSCNLCWRFYLDTSITERDARIHMSNGAKNVLTVGYAKMDGMGAILERPRERKRIILAPHHTIKMDELPLSNFLAYSEFFQELPQQYPDIDFVFRPHPLLRVTLEREDVWGKERTDVYFNKMAQKVNVEYQDGGDYLETFVNSDAIIHDCGSFAAEYLFTGHPACFILKDDSIPNRYLNNLMQGCLNAHYKAYSCEDIIDFINKVVIAGKDDMGEVRKSFFEENLKFKYPYVSKAILDDIKSMIGIS